MFSPSEYLPLLFSALALVICVFSFFFFRSYLRARTGQERILAELREEVNNILKSIDETAERDISLIEEREKNLKGLLEEAEKRIRTYTREMEVRRGAEEAYAALGKNRFRETPQAAVPPPVEAPPQPPPAESPAADPPSVNEQIYSLVRAGFSAPVIASRLGISIAQVELTAALLGRRDAQ